MKLPRNVSGAALQASLRRLGYDTVRQRGSHVRINGEHHEVIPLHTPIRVNPKNAWIEDRLVPEFVRIQLATLDLNEEPRSAEVFKLPAAGTGRFFRRFDFIGRWSCG